MQKIFVTLWEMTKEEAAAMPEGSQFLVYNKIMDYYRIETGGKNNIAKSPDAADHLVYISLTGIDHTKEGKQ